ncbi:MAG: MATE family efflux transporter [Clostridia bacterium]|nr:MATE family efflux transporter [Clostridia bacterium]
MSVFSKKDINIIDGPVLPNMLRYALPIMLTNILQLFYNSADMFVIGNFCDDPNALGSVGCTGSLINMILGVFIGFGAGVAVTLAQSIGAGNRERASRIVHTSFCLSIVLGIIVTVLGNLISEPILHAMNTPDVFLRGATLYVKIYFCGSIANIMYNFFAGILRSRGDTVRPLLFSMAGGIVNIILNLIFVLVFKMGVEGVAIATIVSQFISAVLVIIHMTKLNDECHLDFKKLGFDISVLKQLTKVGLPAGIQGALFSVSNMILQTGYNSLGPVIVNANVAAMNVDGYIYNILNSFYHTCLTFCSQNFGAKRFDRVKKVFFVGTGTVTALGLVLGLFVYTFAEPLVGIFNSDPEILVYAKQRLALVALPYFLCGLMDVGSGFLRSIGYSFRALIITFLGSCVLRIVWVYTVFPIFNDVRALYAVFPVSWFITAATLFVMFFLCYKKEKKMLLNPLK